MKAVADRSLLVIVDIQVDFMRSIEQPFLVQSKALFVAQAAKALGIPILATVQNPTRLGNLAPDFLPLLSLPPMSKMSFSACGAPGFWEKFSGFQRNQVVIVGVESHICVTQTALELASKGIEAFVVSDAIGARVPNGATLPRLRHAGVDVLPSESAVYEWLETADHPQFKQVLALVKKYSESMSAERTGPENQL